MKSIRDLFESLKGDRLKEMVEANRQAQDKLEIAVGEITDLLKEKKPVNGAADNARVARSHR